MQNRIAVRPASYGQYAANAFAHLQHIGITNVELDAPPLDQVEAVQARLNEFGLTATSLNGRTNLEQEQASELIRPALEAAQAMGVPIIFTSVKAGNTPKDVAYQRLRQIGELAAQYNTTIALETHPDLCENGTVALQTMLAVNHPNVRINFDPANLYYYNQGIDAVTELRRITPYVASVHLKDTNGGYHAWHFPALGEGVVDFPAIFRIMNEQGMYGPYTMELEGIEGETLTEEQAQERVAKSLAYLKQIGVV